MIFKCQVTNYIFGTLYREFPSLVYILRKERVFGRYITHLRKSLCGETCHILSMYSKILYFKLISVVNSPFHQLISYWVKMMLYKNYI